MTDYNAAPRPERSHKELRLSVAQEVLASDNDIGSFPGLHEVKEVDSWQLTNPKEIALAYGFRRARTILQAISYGHDYWRIESGLMLNLGERPADEHPGVTEGTRRLLELAVLSRALVRPIDEQWLVPTDDEVHTAKEGFRYELLVTSKDIDDFSGVDYNSIADAIIAGRVTLGNADQPEVQCWRP